MVNTFKVVLQVCIYNIAYPIEANLFEQIFQGLVSGSPRAGFTGRW